MADNQFLRFNGVDGESQEQQSSTDSFDFSNIDKTEEADLNDLGLNWRSDIGTEVEADDKEPPLDGVVIYSDFNPNTPIDSEFEYDFIA